MWTPLAFLALVLVLMFWLRREMEPDPGAATQVSTSPPGATTNVHSTAAAPSSLSYYLKPRDYFMIGMTLWNHRFLQLILLGFFISLGYLGMWEVLWEVLRYGTPKVILVAGAIHLLFFCVITPLGAIVIPSCIVAFIATPLWAVKWRRVVCLNVLEITDDGLRATNHTNKLHSWQSVRLIQNRFGFLFISVRWLPIPMYYVPKRAFAASEISAFESELRRRAPKARR